MLDSIVTELAVSVELSIDVALHYVSRKRLVLDPSFPVWQCHLMGEDYLAGGD